MRGIVGLMVAGLVAGGAHAGAAPRSGVDGKAALERLKTLTGNTLVLTHYCAMGNQPRMRLVEASGTDPMELRFDFTGGTNIDPAKDMHMHAGTLTLRGADRLEAVWSLYDKGKRAGSNKFFLDRVKAAARLP